MDGEIMGKIKDRESILFYMDPASGENWFQNIQWGGNATSLYNCPYHEFETKLTYDYFDEV